MAVSAVLGGWLGSQLDGRFGTEPFGFVIGLALGFAIGLVTLFRGVSRPLPAKGPASQDDTASDDERSTHPPQ